MKFLSTDTTKKLFLELEKYLFSAFTKRKIDRFLKIPLHYEQKTLHFGYLFLVSPLMRGGQPDHQVAPLSLGGDTKIFLI